MASRYDAIIATLVGLCALCVSGYTAYMQRQQVRAAVWPILQFNSSNAPIHFILANKGVGPAIIRHVVVKVDGQPVRNWKEALERILGPGEHLGSESDMSGRVFAAGESMTVFTPHDPENNPLNFDKSNPLWVKLNKDRLRVTAHYPSLVVTYGPDNKVREFRSPKRKDEGRQPPATAVRTAGSAP